jgi:DNA-binding CsgD family transcriptional regulator
MVGSPRLTDSLSWFHRGSRPRVCAVASPGKKQTSRGESQTRRYSQAPRRVVRIERMGETKTTVSRTERSRGAGKHDDDDVDRMRALLQKREAPRFFICDRAGDIVFSTPELVDNQIVDNSKRALEKLFAVDDSIVETHFECLDASTMLRIIPLTGQQLGYFAVFLEPLSGRNSLQSASRRYALTKREGEVLSLILGGLSTVQIARKLFISEGTVGDHVKNLFRKTKTKRRSELVARIFDADGPRVTVFDGWSGNAQRPGSPLTPEISARLGR